MQAAIYARYSSENQRPESIDDQISSCRKLAKERQYDVDQGHIYTDEAASGAREDRPGLAALRAAAVAGEFRVLLIDDLSRLARNTLLLLSVLEELRFHGVRVVSVADGLDTDDQDATVGIQMRGVFNELQLMDLRKKTLRGQIGQKQRGFIVGEATFGYRSVAVGEVTMDKKGRPRPEGYKMTVDPQEAAVILRIFKEFVAGSSESRIVRRLNADGVPGPRWTPQKRPLIDTSKAAISGMAAETGGVLPRGLRGAQVGLDLRAPAAWPALEDMAMMQQAIQQGGDGRGVAESFAPVVNGPASSVSEARVRVVHH